MKLLEITAKYRVENEIEAKEAIEEFRIKQSSEEYALAKAGYEHKEKKSKGEIIDECEIVTIKKVYGGTWVE